MEMDKRISEIETELKIVKGEIKELLVDIRDMMNKNENPFCIIPRLESLEIGATKEEEQIEKRGSAYNHPIVAQNGMTDNGEAEFKKVEEIPKFEDQIVKNNGNSLRSAGLDLKNPAQDIEKQEICMPEPASHRKIDVFMLVELMRWADYAVRTVGHDNLEELLNLYTLIGQLPEETKRIIENISNLSTEDPARKEQVDMKDNIMVLSQLSAILNPESLRKSTQPLYESSQDWKEKESKKKAGLIFN